MLSLTALLTACNADHAQMPEPPPPQEAAQFEIKISQPEKGSPRGEALVALEQATDFVLYSLRPEDPMFAPDSRFDYGTPAYEADVKPKVDAFKNAQAINCKRTGCLYGNPVLGMTAIKLPGERELLRDTLARSLGKVPNYGMACAAQYRHAISFSSGGKRYEILLCYGCGQIGIGQDGKLLLGSDQAYDMGSEAKLDAILKTAGIELAPKPDH